MEHLKEAAEYASDKRCSLKVIKNGIMVIAFSKCGTTEASNIVPWVEIETCVINPLTKKIDRMLAAVS